MHNASINKEVTEANHQSGSISSQFRCNNNMALYVMHKKGFIDMVKGLLAWFISVFKSSGPSPSTSSTSSTNFETIIISNITRQEIKVL